MSAFEFLISFYGILLGLGLAELAGGFSRAWDRRTVHRVGWLTPLLAVIVLADLVSFWTNTWVLRERIEVDYLVAFGAAAITLIFYFATTQVFPREGSQLSSDDHMLAHRKVVIGSIILCNVLMTFGFAAAMDAGIATIARVFVSNIPFLTMLLAVGWLRNRTAILATLIIGVPLTIFYDALMAPIMRWIW